LFQPLKVGTIRYDAIGSQPQPPVAVGAIDQLSATDNTGRPFIKRFALYAIGPLIVLSVW